VTAPPKFARCVAVHSNGAKSGRTCGRTCATALSGVAVSATGWRGKTPARANGSGFCSRSSSQSSTVDVEDSSHVRRRPIGHKKNSAKGGVLSGIQVRASDLVSTPNLKPFSSHRHHRHTTVTVPVVGGRFCDWCNGCCGRCVAFDPRRFPWVCSFGRGVNGLVATVRGRWCLKDDLVKRE